MRFSKLSAVLIFVCFGIQSRAQAQTQSQASAPEQKEQKLAVTGKLVRQMAIGAESTGWAIEFDPAITIEDKQVHSLQVSYSNSSKLEKLENKQVKASGKLGHKQGVETGQQPVLEIASIKEVKTPAADKPSTY
jgi:uncharacterized membrane protein YcgQ (UPF0703/DUF1980 family)